MTAEPYDFRNASRPGAVLDRRLAGWLRAAAGLSARRWTPLLSFAAAMHARGHQLVPPGPCIAGLPEDATCLRVGWHGQRPASGSPAATTLAVVARPLTLALLAGLMGETVEGPVQDRPLTAVEESLCGYLVETLLIGLLRDTWPASEPALLTVEQAEAELRSTRVFPPGDPIFLCSFRVTGPFGEGEWWWLVPRGNWVNWLVAEPPSAPSNTGQPEVKAQLARLVEQFPVRLSIRLGTTEVSLQQLSRLRPGDVILLDQRVHEPLQAFVAETEKFHVWPGAVGARQAVEIHSLLDGQ
jgi:flagellar motor switch protein FliM